MADLLTSRSDPALFSPRGWLIAAANCAVLALVVVASCRSNRSYHVHDRVLIQAPVIREASGLTASRRADGLFWTHNDSGGQPAIYGVARDGHFVGSVRVAGATNVDWEDIAAFEFAGKPHLLIADVGDNNGNHALSTLYVIEEPDPAELAPDQEKTAPLSWKIAFRYENGAHDCEAVAVDGKDETVYLLTKRSKPPMLFTLPLRPPQGAGRNQAAPFVAKHVTNIVTLPQPSRWQRLLPVPRGRYRGQPTGLAFSPQGTQAAVLTYGDVLLYARAPGQTWVQALSGLPDVLEPHDLGQAEGICFSADGAALLVTGEQVSPPLVRYELEQATGAHR
jgi:hypothetical protein